MSHATDTIFSLDIGTRSVVGLLVQCKNDQFSIIDYEIVEHKERSMLDGQIHDIEAVSKVIHTIKDQLSNRNGPLYKVNVAAAGRSLKTKRVLIDHTMSGQGLLTNDDVRSLELTAIQEAQKEIANEQDESDVTKYYCVGYSVVNYYLDGQLIGNLVNQRGSQAKVDIIATFLPRIVVDSLITALQQAGLSMETLTLEPIAAINVLIPSTMRKLNIALVDIGAGTSDIAITAEGTITAYGMVPKAGDEITEALSQSFLLDFHVAEEVKRRLGTKDTVSFTDVLGFDYSLSSTEVIAGIEKDISDLANEICNKVMELNGKAPQAVMLIGGGSLTPGLSDFIASRLNLPAARVAVRGTNAIKNLMDDHQVIKGPEFITPVGIAAAANKHPVRYITVHVNDQEVHIFDLKKILVGDVLLHAGFEIKKLYGRPGLAIAIKVNGTTRFIPGGWGHPPTLLLNQIETHLDGSVQNQDRLTVIPGKDGKPAEPTLLEIIDQVETLDVYIQDELHSLPPLLQVNGVDASLNTVLNDRDDVIIRLPKTVSEVLKAVACEHLLEKKKSLDYIMNGQQRRWECSETGLFVNGECATSARSIYQGDRIEVKQAEQEPPSILSLIPNEEVIQLYTEVTFNGDRIRIPNLTTQIFVNGELFTQDRSLQNGDKINYELTHASSPIFSDVLRFTEIDFKQNNKHLLILINGQPATFLSEISNGDVLELRWE